jgi:hypothetical protein
MKNNGKTMKDFDKPIKHYGSNGKTHWKTINKTLGKQWKIMKTHLKKHWKYWKTWNKQCKLMKNIEKQWTIMKLTENNEK